MIFTSINNLFTYINYEMPLTITAAGAIYFYAGWYSSITLLIIYSFVFFNPVRVTGHNLMANHILYFSTRQTDKI